MNGCMHTPACGTASVHHARRGQEARLAREAARVAAEAARPPRLERSADWYANGRGVASCKANPATVRASIGRAPWELTDEEFDAVCEPRFESMSSGTPGHRMFGLRISHMRFGVRLRLVMLGGPTEGYVADVEWSDEASLEDARRAFVVEALSRGERVPADVLADYPDLQSQD
jgi:hypothetical protein